MQTESPDSVNPLANANPPPNKRTIPQGILLKALKSNSADFPDFDGIKNKINAIVIATVPSSINLAVGKRFDQPGIVKNPKKSYLKLTLDLDDYKNDGIILLI